MAIKKSVAANEVLKRAVAQLSDRSTGWASEIVMHGRKATTLLEGLEAITLARNPSETPEAHALRVNKAAQKVLGQVEELRGKIHDARTNAARSITQQIQEQTKLFDGPRGAEIRGLFRSLPAEERTKIIEGAIAKRDAETLGALFAAPAYLSGMDPEYQSRMKHHYEVQVVPELHAAMDEVLSVDSAIATINRVVSEAGRDALAPDYVARIQQEQAKAERAQAGFDGALAE